LRAPLIERYSGTAARLVTGRLLTAEEVAELLSVPVSWVRESTRSGAMPVVELGRYKRYRRDEVEAWLEGCSRPGRTIALRVRP
jgi:excisionase family DNA binding protein